jgi:hypothetical protein
MTVVLHVADPDDVSTLTDAASGRTRPADRSDAQAALAALETMADDAIEAEATLASTPGVAAGAALRAVAVTLAANGAILDRLLAQVSPDRSGGLPAAGVTGRDEAATRPRHRVTLVWPDRDATLTIAD